MEVYPNAGGAPYIKAKGVGVAGEASTLDVEVAVTHLGPFELI